MDIPKMNLKTLMLLDIYRRVYSINGNFRCPKLVPRCFMQSLNPNFSDNAIIEIHACTTTPSARQNLTVKLRIGTIFVDAALVPWQLASRKYKYLTLRVGSPDALGFLITENKLN